ncbi:MAG: ATP-dependent DNA helicase, partial [Patescibacteria group bacterium]
GLDARTIAELNLLAQMKGKSLFEACEMAPSIGKFSADILETLRKILFQLHELRTTLKGKPATECFKQLVRKLGYLEYLNAKPEAEKMETFRYLNQFLDRVKSFESRNDQKTLHAFLEEFAHERDAGEEGSLSIDFDSGPELVRIMTVHASKGLEFKHVFIANLVDRRFPAQARGESIPIPEGLFKSTIVHDDAHLHEERRLFYVAMTRAKEGLYFTSADDYGGSRARKLSRFLHELGYEKPNGQDRALVHLFDEDRGEETEHLSKTEISIPVPKQFSFTQLAAFKTCPYQYKFAHVLKVPVFGRWTFSFGKTMHNTLQNFFTLWLERTGKKQSSLFEANPTMSDKLPVSEQELLRLYEQSWIDDWYENDKQREEYRLKGREALQAYFKSFSEKTPVPLFLEQGFTLKFGDVVLKGRIDRMDTFEDGVEIIDYKTGSPKTEKTLRPEDREQLFLYQMAAIDVLGLNPKKLTYHYLEDNSEVSFIGTDDQLAKLRENIIDRVQMIRKSQFEATPGFHCRFCDFADICEFRQ